MGTGLGGIVVPLLIASSGGDVNLRRPAPLLILGICALSAASLTWLTTRDEARWISLTFWLFAYIWLGVAPLAQLAAGSFPLLAAFPSVQLDPGAVLQGATLAVLGLGGWLVGGLLGGWLPSGGPARARLRPIASVHMLAWAILVVAVGRLLLLGPGVIFESRAAFGEARGVTVGDTFGAYLTAIVMQLAPLVALFVLLAHQRRESTRWWSITTTPVLLILLAGFVFTVTNPISAARFLMGAMLLGLAFTWIGSGHGRVSVVLVIGLVTATLIVFPLLDTFRRTATPEIEVRPLSVELTTSGDFGVFPQLQIAVDATPQAGHRPQQLLGPVFFFLPRSIWRDKPFDTGAVLAADVGLRESLNMPAPLWAELFVAGGPLVVLLGFLALGAATRWLEDRYVRRRSTLHWIDVAVPIFAAYQIFVLRGSLLGAVPRLVGLLLLSRLFFVFLGERTAVATPPTG